MLSQATRALYVLHMCLMVSACMNRVQPVFKSAPAQLLAVSVQDVVSSIIAPGGCGDCGDSLGIVAGLNKVVVCFMSKVL